MIATPNAILTNGLGAAATLVVTQGYTPGVVVVSYAVADPDAAVLLSISVVATSTVDSAAATLIYF